MFHSDTLKCRSVVDLQKHVSWNTFRVYTQVYETASLFYWDQRSTLATTLSIYLIRVLSSQYQLFAKVFLIMLVQVTNVTQCWIRQAGLLNGIKNVACWGALGHWGRSKSGRATSRVSFSLRYPARRSPAFSGDRPQWSRAKTRLQKMMTTTTTMTMMNASGHVSDAWRLRYDQIKLCACTNTFHFTM